MGAIAVRFREEGFESGGCGGKWEGGLGGVDGRGSRVYAKPAIGRDRVAKLGTVYSV